MNWSELQQMEGAQDKILEFKAFYESGKDIKNVRARAFKEGIDETVTDYRSRNAQITEEDSRNFFLDEMACLTVFGISNQVNFIVYPNEEPSALAVTKQYFFLEENRELCEWAKLSFYDADKKAEKKKAKRQGRIEASGYPMRVDRHMPIPEEAESKTSSSYASSIFATLLKIQKLDQKISNSQQRYNQAIDSTRQTFNQCLVKIHSQVISALSKEDIKLLAILQQQLTEQKLLMRQQMEHIGRQLQDNIKLIQEMHKLLISQHPLCQPTHLCVSLEASFTSSSSSSSTFFSKLQTRETKAEGGLSSSSVRAGTIFDKLPPSSILIPKADNNGHFCMMDFSQQAPSPTSLVTQNEVVCSQCFR